jgi:polyhydroxyalkanoate synthesis regulator phasin
MVRDYPPTTDAMTLKKVKKLMHDVVKEGKTDREKAYKAYEFFKEIVDEERGAETDIAKKCMVECLKAARESRNNTNKVFAALVQLYTASMPKSNRKDDTGSQTLHDLLTELDNDA